MSLTTSITNGLALVAVVGLMSGCFSPGVFPSAGFGSSTGEVATGNADPLTTSDTGAGASSAPSGDSGDSGDSVDSGPPDSGESDSGPSETPHMRWVFEVSESYFLSSDGYLPQRHIDFYPHDAGRRPDTGWGGLGNFCGMTEVDGCVIVSKPECPTPCGAEQSCQFTDGCEATCRPLCDRWCPSGQECFHPQAGFESCRERWVFDAGLVSVEGLTGPAAFYAPYELSFPDLPEPITTAGTDVGISSPGARGPGLQAFSTSIPAIPSPETNLASLTHRELFGTGPITLTWKPDDPTDEIWVGGYVQDDSEWHVFACQVEDTGTRTVSRDVINAAVNNSELAFFDPFITRIRRRVTMGWMTQGSIPEHPFEADAWVELVLRQDVDYVFSRDDPE